jgi:hypothetical protein
MKATCGHLEEKSFTNANDGLCRKCHSNFAFLLEIESKYGEDALVEYWYAMILTHLSSRQDKQGVKCFIEHLTMFYQRKLVEVPSKENYTKKMLYMLHSIQEPFDIEDLR